MIYSVHLSEIVGFQLRTSEICSWWNWRGWPCWFESSFKRISKTNWYVQWLFILNIIDFTVYFTRKSWYKKWTIFDQFNFTTFNITILDSQRYQPVTEILFVKCIVILKLMLDKWIVSFKESLGRPAKFLDLF